MNAPKLTVINDYKPVLYAIHALITVTQMRKTFKLTLKQHTKEVKLTSGPVAQLG